jgi:endonuclease-3
MLKKTEDFSRACMEDKDRAFRILQLLRETYPETKRTSLRYETPFQLLIATVLSAQCTDKKVNQVTRELFRKYRTAKDFAEADINELKKAIRPTGFYSVKAKRIKEIGETLVRDYGSDIPRTVDQLTRLKGVARKTANIVLTNAYGIVEGIAVDTHVMRLSQRLGLTMNENRDKIEKDLMEIIPKENWPDVNTLLVEHGRKICRAQRPKCKTCVIRDLCPSGEQFIRTGKNGA